MMILKTVFTLLLFGFPNSSFSARKNVLFIGSDDMRPNINIYSDATDYAKPTMHTPNLDKVTNNENMDFGFCFFDTNRELSSQLGGRSIVFESAYVQQALCSPSRSSLMTSRRCYCNICINIV